LLGKFKSAVENRDKSWYIRGTYTARNKDFSNDVLHLADLGFTRLSVEPVVSPADASLDLCDGDAPALCAEYEKLALALRERQKKGETIDFFHFNIDLEFGPCAARQIKGCGAGYEYAAVVPSGDIYPCHQFAGVSDFKIGSVYEGITNLDITDKFKKTSIYSKRECEACWARFFCGGGCAANFRHYGGDISKPNELYCRLFKKRTECALWLKYAP